MEHKFIITDAAIPDRLGFKQVAKCSLTIAKQYILRGEFVCVDANDAEIPDIRGVSFDIPATVEDCAAFDAIMGDPDVEIINTIEGLVKYYVVNWITT